MDLREILYQLKSGKIDVEEATSRIRLLALKEMEGACIDVSRNLRKGVPEVIFGEGKSDDTLIGAANALLQDDGVVIVTRVTPAQAELLIKNFSGKAKTTHYERGRVVSIRRDEAPPLKDPPVAIITAGSSDIPVAEEALAVVNEMGFKTITFYDVGIAGLHRIFPVVKKCIEEHVKVAIVVAGMEGALPSVFSTLFPGVVIGVPSSVGYGHGGRGEGALTTMLQSCSPGLVVVNIDNGVGAAIAAVLISRLKSEDF
ncbi:MAG: nickel pincer cofactor biosynthesis protein LarB [Candidatus Methanomethylicia archaeon]|nr:nickel pincer cofactor biosynthesis protein LarB [Candidatus Methanomethylicia archaeon]